MNIQRPLMVALAALCLVLAAVALFDFAVPAALAADAVRHGGLDWTALGTATAWSGVAFGIGRLGDVNDMRKKRSDLVAKLDELAKGEQTDETRSKFDEIEGEVAQLDADIKRAERLQDLRRANANAQVPADGEGDGEQQQRGDDPFARALAVAPAPAERRDIGLEFGGFVRSFAQSAFLLRSGGSYVTPAQIARDLYGERHPVTEAATRAQSLSDNAAGGLTVPQVYASEIIRLFGPNTIVRKRANVVPGNASYLKGRTGATVGYVGEMEQGQVTGVTFGLIDMKEKDISAILPISKKLLRNTAFGVESYCRDELVRAAGEFEDMKFLYGTGVDKQVKGYKYAIKAAHKFAAANKTAPTNAEVRTELRKPLKALATANVPYRANNPAWFMHESVKMYLEDLYQGDLKAFPTLEGENPTLYGFPVDTSTQIVGPDGDGGDIFFGAHRYAMIGDSVSMSLSVSDQASFKDAAGNQVNLWAQGMMAIKLDMSHDFAFRHDDAFAVIEAVKWGQ